MKIGNYRLIKCIGKGSFGKVYKAVCDENDRIVAVKFERKNAKFPQLRYEHRVLNLLREAPGVPNTYGKIGSHRNYHYFVLDYFPVDIQKLFSRQKHLFTNEFIYHIVYSVISILEGIHDVGVIHRDLKPGNMMYDRESNQVFLIDFGLSKRYIDPITKQHIEYMNNKSLCGTPRFASINCHKGIQLTRRDDIESLSYILVYFLKGRLPWMSKGKLSNNEIKRMKMNTSSRSLSSDLDEEVYKFVRYAKSLKFTQRPDYDYLRSLLEVHI